MITEKGLRFPCPYPQDEGHQFSDFLSVPKDLIYNPWPETVDLNYRRYAWTQPILRLEYRPELQRHEADSLKNMPLKRLVSHSHERIHLYLAFTPAKHYMRIGLGETFEFLEDIVDTSGTHPSRDFFADRFNIVQEKNELLGEHSSKIVLAEELMATTCSFRNAELLVTVFRDLANKQSEMRTLEAEWIDRQVDGLNNLSEGMGRKFQELYEPFKKVARLLQEYPTRTRNGRTRFWYELLRLARFLEPISIEGESIEVIDCEERCYELAHAMKKIETGEELVKWLNKSIRRSADLRSLRLLMEIALDLFTISVYMYDLYALAAGSPPQMANPEQFVKWIQKQYYKMPPIYDDRRLKTTFYPQYIGGRWYIRAEINSQAVDHWTYRQFLAFEPLKQQFMNDHWTYHQFLAFEALRQQIMMGEGFRCPFICMQDLSATKDGHQCLCKDYYPSFRVQLAHLISLARDGAFGDGNWGDLPYPCGPIT